MRWSDFEEVPRDWEYVKAQLETARAYAVRLAGGEAPWKGRTGAFTKAYRSEVDDTLQPYALYVRPRTTRRRRGPWWWACTAPARTIAPPATPLSASATRRRGRRGDPEGRPFPDVGFLVLTPYARGESAGYGGLAESDVLRVMEHVQRAYRVDPDRVHLTGSRWVAAGPGTSACATPTASPDPRCAGSPTWTSCPGPQAGERSTGAHEPDRLHATRRERVEPAGLRLRRRGRRREGPGLAKDDGGLREGGPGRTSRSSSLPGVTHFSWDFAYRDASLFRRVEGMRRNPFPEGVVPTRRLAALPQGLLAAHRPYRAWPHPSGSRARRRPRVLGEDRESLRLLAVAGPEVAPPGQPSR